MYRGQLQIEQGALVIDMRLMQMNYILSTILVKG